MKEKLSHIGDDGKARMVDVSGKGTTVRTARAEALIRVGPAVAELIREKGGVSKGDVLDTARLAGIMGAKRTPDLIPMCHPLAVDKVDMEAVLDGDTVRLTCEARCTGRTGVEMEAMVGASLAALTVYDMCKSAEKGMEILGVRLMEKSGGKSGTWRREDGGARSATAELLAVCISPGGVPKVPVPSAAVGEMGLEGDGRDHDKHWKPERAVSIQDEELIHELAREGYEVDWGTMGENLTVRHLDVQGMAEGTRLEFSGGLEVELTGARKPCFVLDKIHPKLKVDVVGRCGQMAKVVKSAVVKPGESVHVVPPGDNGS